jgi:hypothetical protein
MENFSYGTGRSQTGARHSKNKLLLKKRALLIRTLVLTAALMYKILDNQEGYQDDNRPRKGSSHPTDTERQA